MAMALNIDLGSAVDTVTIESTHASVTNLFSHGGDDVIDVRNTVGATNIYTGSGTDTTSIKSILGATLVHAGEGADIVNVGNDLKTLRTIDATLTINGDAGFDTVNIENNASTTPTPGQLYRNLLSGLDMGGSIVYDTVEDLNIDLGAGNDDFIIASTHTGTTDITGNTGNNRFLIKTIDGPTTVASSNGNDTVTVGDLLNPLTNINAAS